MNSRQQLQVTTLLELVLMKLWLHIMLRDKQQIPPTSHDTAA